MKEQADSCGGIEGHLPLYVGGDLDPVIARAVQDHLRSCVACQAKSERARQAREILVAGLKSAGDGPRDLWPAVRMALHNEGWITSTARARVETPRAAPTPMHALAPAAPRRNRLRVLSLAAGVLFAGFLAVRVSTESNSSPTIVEPTAHSVSTGAPIAPQVAAPVQIVSTNGPAGSTGEFVKSGLRRLAPGEAGLSDTAELYDPEANWNGLRWTSDKNVGSPASLQRVSPRFPPNH